MSGWIGNIFLLASIQGILLTVFLLFSKNNIKANRVLSVTMFFLSLDLLSVYSFTAGWYKTYPVIFGANFGFPFIYGPIFYLYAKFITGKEEKFSAKYLVHFIPFILAHLYVSPFYFLSEQEKIQQINVYISDLQIDLIVISALKPIHGLIYTLYSLKLLKEFNTQIKNSYSNIEQKKLGWLRNLIIGVTLIWLIVAFTFVYTVILSLGYSDSNEIIYFSIAIFIYTVGYGALYQPEMFAKKEQNISSGEVVVGETPQQEKYSKSNLSENQIEEIKTSLISLMENKKAFLNSELTIDQLALEIGVSKHNLSETINSAFQKNFYDFVNSYRVEDFKQRIKNPEFANYSLIAVAFESGFSSKSSFNTIFKKYTGTTPSEYRKQSAS